jgi:adenine phosphoribosyltransferase
VSASAEPAGDSGPDIARKIESRLRDVPDFPKPGILFKDISPLLADPEVFGSAISALATFAESSGEVDVVAGIEARGFLIAGALACELGCGLVPVRKAGKLPPPTVRRNYALEYGTAEIEVPVQVLTGRRVLVVDDVLATGGTMRAAVDLIAQAEGSVVGVAVLLELGFLDGRAFLGGVAPLHALLSV